MQIQAVEQWTTSFLERLWEFDYPLYPLYICFVDLVNSYNQVPLGHLWGVLWMYGVQELLLQAVRWELCLVLGTKSSTSSEYVGLCHLCPSPRLWSWNMFNARVRSQSQAAELSLLCRVLGSALEIEWGSWTTRGTKKRDSWDGSPPFWGVPGMPNWEETLWNPLERMYISHLAWSQMIPHEKLMWLGRTCKISCLGWMQYHQESD